MALTQQAIDVILEHPLQDALNYFRHKLHEFDDADPGQEDIASLLGALVCSKAAFNFPTPDGVSNPN
jgi:hypothetical protein